jgi:hypothetical protein
MKYVLGQGRLREILVARGGVGLCGLLVLIGVAGCPGVVPPTDSGVLPPNSSGEIVDGNRDTSVTSPLGKTSGEPNGVFSDPVVAVFDSTGTARLQGTVETVDDLDVYRLGALSPGDRIIVDAYANGSPLDVTIALFDDLGRLVYNNDDREAQSSCGLVAPPTTACDAYIDFVVRHAGNSYYLAVSHSPFAGSRQFVGSYRVDIVVNSGFDVPQPVAQTLLLDFDGAVVNSPMLGQMTLTVFNAADISPVYEGTTQTVKDRIRDVFDQNYERFNVIILTTDDPPPPPGTVYSTIFFGGFDRDAFGLAEDVDLYDIDRCDDALIFTKSFTPSVFTGVPTATELGTAIGNIGTHEAGHLLGLNHTDDDLDLMDDQSPADAFLLDQEFMEAPLSTDIMPIGTQDGVLLLDESVGPREPM